MVKREMREQIQEENHTSFVSGNNEVDTDSSSSFTHGFSGYDLQNPSMISRFYGKEASCKNEQWLN